MQREFDRRAMEATALLLVAGGLLIGASVAGIGGSLPLIAALVLLAAVLAAVRHSLPQPGVVLGHDLDLYVRDLWGGPALAAAATVYVFGATPGEVQTVGGVLGFIGMLNYFLRPVYHMGYSAVESVVDAVA